MRSRWTYPLLLTAVIACATAARPQAANDSFFSGIEKFERNAVHVTRVESDHDHSRRDDPQSPNTPKRLSTVYVFGYDRPGLYNPADVDVYRRKLHTAEWSCKICEGRLKPGEALDACTRSLGPSTTESVVIDMRLDKLTFVHTIGRASSDGNVTTCREE